MTVRCWFHVRDLVDPFATRSFPYAAVDFVDPAMPTCAEARADAWDYARGLRRPQIVRVRIEAELAPGGAA